MSNTRETLIDLIKAHALKRGDFTLSSGKKSSYYLDVRQLTLHSQGAQIIADLLLDLIEDVFPATNAVGGMGFGAAPIVGAILASVGEWVGYGGYLLGFTVRKEPKDHGTKKLVEGPLLSGMSVVIVEDVATTGASALAAADAVLAMNCHVAAIITVVDRLEGAEEACAARGIPFKSLVTIQDLGIEPYEKGNF